MSDEAFFAAIGVAGAIAFVVPLVAAFVARSRGRHPWRWLMGSMCWTIVLSVLFLQFWPLWMIRLWGAPRQAPLVLVAYVALALVPLALSVSRPGRRRVHPDATDVF